MPGRVFPPKQAVLFSGDAVQQAALLNNVLNERGEGLGLVRLAGGKVPDEPGVEIHLHLVAVLNVPGGLVAL